MSVETNIELENLVRQDLSNLDSWLVYADWLQRRGDPRGELISLEVELEKKYHNDIEKIEIEKRIDEIVSIYKKQWIHPELLSESRKKNIDIGFRYGWITFLKVRYSDVLISPDSDSDNSLEWADQLKMLSTLDLSFIGLTELPEWFDELTQLNDLFLSTNRLTELPVAIRNFRQLQFLSVNNNQISRLPDWLTELPKLKEFDVSDNPITRIQGSIKAKFC